jgi:NAD+ synthase (glutamine-hydrolysing)
LYNSAAVLLSGDVLTIYRKQKLPNYGVFDEQRYFSAGTDSCVFELKSQYIGIGICEDAWHSEIVEATKAAGAEILVTLNASPFHSGKAQKREAIISKNVSAAQLPIVYVNMVGGQDELVFDGASFVMNKNGEVVLRAQEFVEEVRLIEFDGAEPISAYCAPTYLPLRSDYAALVCGTRDYVFKNGFKGAILGLSGGIDSALVLAIAVDALGAENVEVVSLPSRYTQAMSNDDAKEQAHILGVTYHCIPIEPAVNAFTAMLEDTFANTQSDTTEENIQARCRGVVLMAMSNKQGKLQGIKVK